MKLNKMINKTTVDILSELGMNVYMNNIPSIVSSLNKLANKKYLVERWFTWVSEAPQDSKIQDFDTSRKVLNYMKIEDQLIEGYCQDESLYNYLGCYFKSIEAMSLVYDAYLSSFRASDPSDPNESNRMNEASMKFIETLSLHGLFSTVSSIELINFIRELNHYTLSDKGRSILNTFKNWFLLDRKAMNNRPVIHCINLLSPSCTKVSDFLIMISEDDTIYFAQSSEVSKMIGDIREGVISLIRRKGSSSIFSLSPEIQKCPYLNNILCYMIIDFLKDKTIIFSEKIDTPSIPGRTNVYAEVARRILCIRDEEGNTILHKGHGTNLIFCDKFTLPYILPINHKGSPPFHTSEDNGLIYFYNKHLPNNFRNHKNNEGRTIAHSIKNVYIAQCLFKLDYEYPNTPSLFLQTDLLGNPTFFNVDHGDGIQERILKHLNAKFNNNLDYLKFLNKRRESIFFYIKEDYLLRTLIDNYPDEINESFKTLIFLPNGDGDYCYWYSYNLKILKLFLNIYEVFFREGIFPNTIGGKNTFPSTKDFIFRINPDLVNINLQMFLNLLNYNKLNAITISSFAAKDLEVVNHLIEMKVTTYYNISKNVDEVDSVCVPIFELFKNMPDEIFQFMSTNSNNEICEIFTNLYLRIINESKKRNERDTF